MNNSVVAIRVSITVLSVLHLLLFACAVTAQSNLSVYSPDRSTEVVVHFGERLSYSVFHNGNALLVDNTLSTKIDDKTFGLNSKLKLAKPRSVDQMVEPAVRQKFAKLRDEYNELRLDFEGNFAVVFRAYDNGVAYRFETSLPSNEVKVYAEEVTFNFAGEYSVYYPKEDSFFSHNERKFLYLPVREIAKDSIASLPAVVAARDGIKLAICDSDVDDYPGLWLRGNSNNSLSGIFPPYPLKEELKGDRNYRVTQAADYIAVTKGKRTYPWRLIGIAEKDGDLLTNQMVYLLAKPSQVADTSWVKPGKVAWDWWNFNNIYGVDFKAGVNTETYKYYIDFASKNGIEYIILFYHKICREAAKRKMLVDFHGAIRPATMTRTWPNLLSTEGVLGLEQCKWSDICQPEHNVTLPFTRMFMGPMDYTPGAMVNATKKTFAPIFNQPMSLGTRCHQLAMYVVYESPLQMLADYPSNYMREPETMSFLGPVPTVWDDTKVLDAKIGDYVVIARRKGNEWYVGAMTDWTAREFEIDLSFLGDGRFDMESFQDGANATRNASDYKKVTTTITRATKLKIKLAEGGGWVARIYPAGTSQIADR